MLFLGVIVSPAVLPVDDASPGYNAVLAGIGALAGLSGAATVAMSA